MPQRQIDTFDERDPLAPPSILAPVFQAWMAAVLFVSWLAWNRSNPLELPSILSIALDVGVATMLFLIWLWLNHKNPLTMPFLGSFTLHVCLLAVMFMSWFWLDQKPESFGDANPSGGQAYAVSPTKSIPIPQKDALPNPVAHDTESLVPTAPAPKEVEKKLPEPTKDAFEIPDKLKPQKEQPKPQQKYLPPAPPNQVTTTTPQAMSNPMYAAQAGSGKVGIGPNSVFGNRLGWYAQLIRDRIAQNWQTNGLNGRLQTSPAIIDFHIMRDGSIRDPRIVQSSGNPEIDNTALRAVYASNPLNPLPPQVTENDILAEFTFNLR